MDLVRIEKKNIRFLYAYAIVAGAIGLVLPLGIQAVMGLVLGGNLSSGWLILVIVITLGTLIAGLTRLAQLSILEKIQQRLFVNVALDFSRKITLARGQKRKQNSLVEMSEKFLDVITVQKSFSKLVLDFSASVLEILFGIFLLVIYHPYFILFGFTVIFSVGLAIRLTWSRGIASARTESDYKFKTAYWIIEIAQNRTIFNLKSAKPFHLKKADENLQGYLRGRKDHFRILYSQAFIAVIFKVLLTTSLIILGSYLLVNESISIGQFLATEILIFTFLNAVEKLIVTVENIFDSGIALEKLGQVTDISEPLTSDEAETINTNSPVSISIINKKTNEIILEIEKGEKLGICGIPGTGRTQILRAFTGETHPEWKILMNKVPIENVNLRALGLNTGICLQSSDVFEGTLASNIALGEDINMEELAELSQILNLEKFIHSVPEGFLTQVDAQAGLPSNIQKKILLARALYGHPGLILLDDVWSVLNRNEIDNIMKYLNQIESTVIVVSNQMPVLKHLNRYCFMDQGEFTDLGKPDTSKITESMKQILWL